MKLTTQQLEQFERDSDFLVPKGTGREQNFLNARAMSSMQTAQPERNGGGHVPPVANSSSGYRSSSTITPDKR